MHRGRGTIELIDPFRVGLFAVSHLSTLSKSTQVSPESCENSGPSRDRSHDNKYNDSL